MPETHPATSVPIRNLAGTIRVRGEETGGALAVIEHVLPPGYVAMPLHRHTRESVTTYVLEGTLTVKLAGRLHRVHAGEHLVKPVGAFHTVWNAGAGPARFLELIAPAGLERYFEEVAGVIPASGTVPMDRVLELSREYGLEFDMGSLVDIIETHHVRLA
jgi:quercetin dioxygenase-like cupin family protein